MYLLQTHTTVTTSTLNILLQEMLKMSNIYLSKENNCWIFNFKKKLTLKCWTCCGTIGKNALGSN
jgi:hypothetical protein